MGNDRQARIFFALWPDDELRHRLDNAVERLAIERPARRVPAYNLHLTLHFIGNVELERMACLQQAARAVSGRKFELVVDAQGYFPRPRVAWFGCAVVPPRLEQLHRDLGQQLQQCDYRPEARRFQPHVTVARKLGVEPAPADFAPLTWRVEEFVLVESRQIDNGVKYEVVESYPLT